MGDTFTEREAALVLYPDACAFFCRLHNFLNDLAGQFLQISIILFAVSVKAERNNVAGLTANAATKVLC
jgi:hypothetical protein